jgi:hypothetical protein
MEHEKARREAGLLTHGARAACPEYSTNRKDRFWQVCDLPTIPLIEEDMQISRALREDRSRRSQPPVHGVRPKNGRVSNTDAAKRLPATTRCRFSTKSNRRGLY